ncbi:hypothetical protein DRW07_01295 [Alteromonas sediminis]|uniref:PEP-CTERM sorting domain-containing protein n=1 Tax=Alteromonas sediminis TaxID=2259342 RepID=A0A3N5Y527_9ALTE|nr:hypothetical protein [Alteromonas sediminis]RPJ68076.1 hypothetical protein DRW07_01295 [Alteromonas sediminis]
MKKLIAMFVFLLLPVSAGASLITTEHIVNGDFETGDLTGWTNVNTGSGGWAINNGTFDPTGPGLPLSPIDGAFDVVSFQSGGGFHNLYQIVNLPSLFSSATLSWSDRIRNAAGTYSDPNQEWRVLVEDLNGGLIGEVFSTNPDDVLLQTGPNNRSFDLTALLQPLGGQSVRISFEQQDNLFYFNATLDNVSFTTSVVSAPATVVMLGLVIALVRLRRR